MSIYTKTGDKGTTSLASGEVVSKSLVRIDAYGTFDELNAHTGLLRDVLSSIDSKKFSQMISQLSEIQTELFDLGGELATSEGKLRKDTQIITKESVNRLESEIDSYNENLSPLKTFIIPGGHVATSHAHVARTTCRRGERVLTLLSEKESVRDEVLMYVNRLSDWFFVAAREISKETNSLEIAWTQRGKK